MMMVKSVQFILDSFKKALIAKDDISSDESVSKMSSMELIK